MAVAAGLLTAALLVRWQRAEPAATRSPSAARDVSAGAPRPPAARAPATPRSPAPDGASERSGPPPDASAAEDLASLFDERRGAWAAVDLDAAREAMPDNLYWKMAMPTRDPEVLEARKRERERWNRDYGKVLSGTASEAEVRDYYALRHRLSSEYIEFATWILDRYRDVLPERDVGLLELAVRLHAARLQEMPRKLEEALARSRAHAEARRAWLEEQALFEGAPPSEGGAAGGPPLR